MFFRIISAILLSNLLIHSNTYANNTLYAGGIGGNEKTGEKIYDGNSAHLPALPMQVDDNVIYEGYNVCQFQNKTLLVQDVAYPDQRVLISTCYLQTDQHNHTAWLSLNNNETRWDSDAINGAYSPSLDAYYSAFIVQQLFQEWYNIPVVTEADGKTPSQILIRVHYGRRYENAFWDGKSVTFGDGGNHFYPLTSLEMTAHEMAHGFTDQHANIDYSIPQMAALHESFSDITAMAAQYYTLHDNNWQIGYDILKADGAIRYIDNPTKNHACIDNMNEYKNNLEAHAAAGVMNKAFYILATTKNWDTHKAFNIWVKANRDYWTSGMKTFSEAAKGIITSAKDYQYNTNDVENAFKQVGINID